MSDKTVTVVLTVDTSTFYRRLRLLRLILEALDTAGNFEKAFKQYNKVVADFEEEIKRLKGEGE